MPFFIRISISEAALCPPGMRFAYKKLLAVPTKKKKNKRERYK
jgi:hypothetical protein